MKKNDQLISKKDELQSLNEDLYSDLSIEELEKRLETKPWICGAYVDCPALECGGTNNPPPPTEPEPPKES